MRRYRYGDPSKTGFRKWGSVFYFLAAWNVFGFITYKMWSSKKRSQDPEWDNLSATQKYLQLINVSNKDVTKIKIKGLTIQDTEETKDS